MDADTAIRLKELAHQATIEQDAERLVALIREVNRLLAGEIGNLQSQKHITYDEMSEDSACSEPPQ